MTTNQPTTHEKKIYQLKKHELKFRLSKQIKLSLLSKKKKKQKFNKNNR